MYPLDVTMPRAGCCVAGGLELEAAVAHSRHGRSDRRGLGTGPAAAPAQHATAFVAA